MSDIELLKAEYERATGLPFRHGSRAAIADLFNLPYRTVYEWFRRDSVPSGYLATLDVMADRRQILIENEALRAELSCIKATMKGVLNGD